MTDAGAALGSNLKSEIKIQKGQPVGLPPTIRIILEENDNIPPTGLYVGVNGRGYLIRPGEAVNVPRGVVDVLDHAVMASPQIDSVSRRVIGYRERMRYPYRRVAAEAA